MSYLQKIMQAGKRLAEALAAEDSDDDLMSATELAGISPALLEFVDNVCTHHPRTFVDFPFDEEEARAADRFELDPEQNRHATQVLKRCKSLRRCRRALAPAEMTQQRFWKVYFMLVHNLWEEAKAARDAKIKSKTQAKQQQQQHHHHHQQQQQQPQQQQQILQRRALHAREEIPAPPRTTDITTGAAPTTASTVTPLPPAPREAALASQLTDLQADDYFETLWQARYGETPAEPTDPDDAGSEPALDPSFLSTPVRRQEIPDITQEDASQYHPFATGDNSTLTTTEPTSDA